MLVELGLVEQRYKAVCEVLDGATVVTWPAATGWLARRCTAGCAATRPARRAGPAAAPVGVRRRRPRRDHPGRLCDEGQARGEVLALLTRLVERSLVFVDPASADPRYRLLETISQFAAQKLAELGETTARRKRHLAWCVTLAHEAAQGDGAPPHWLTAEEHNLRIALEWATVKGHTEAALRLASAYVLSCRRAGRHGEARKWAERGVLLRKAPGDEAPRVRRLIDAASLAALTGDLPPVQRLKDAVAYAASVGFGHRLSQNPHNYTD